MNEYAVILIKVGGGQLLHGIYDTREQAEQAAEQAWNKRSEHDIRSLVVFEQPNWAYGVR